VADPQQLAAAVLLVARVVGPRHPIEVTEPESTSDLPGIAPVGLLPELLEVELARIAHQDVEARFKAGVHEPTVQPEGLDRHPATRSEALHEGHGLRALPQALVADPFSAIRSPRSSRTQIWITAR